MDLTRLPEVTRRPDLVHRVRGLRFFSDHLAQGLSGIARGSGLAAMLDRRRTTRLFLDWTGEMRAQSDCALCDRRDYIVFAAGLLLRRLVEDRPMEVLRLPNAPAGRAGAPGEAAVAAVWPEGFLAAAYCVAVLDEVLRQEGLRPVGLIPSAGEPRLWLSFRENMSEDSWNAVAFLDLLVGNEPNWTMPQVAAERPALRRAAQAHGGRRLN